GLDTLDGLDDLTVRESRLLHAVELLNEKILLLTTSLFREDYPLNEREGHGWFQANSSDIPQLASPLGAKPMRKRHSCLL
ncbi:hypothetical protein QZM26_30795, partial [Burkholderia multivorans]|nr:hypothetical protein [Burkholderia multivorans]